MDHLNLREHQIALEELASAAAETRALAIAEDALRRGAAAEAGPGYAKAITNVLPKLSQAIAEELSTTSHRGDHIQILSSMNPDILALATLNVLYSAALMGKPLTAALRSLGQSVSVEHYAELAKGLDIGALERIATRGGARAIKGVKGAAKGLLRLIQRHGKDPLAWNQDTHIALGSPLLNIAVEALPGTFEITRDEGEAYQISLTESALEELLEASRAPWVRPRVLPMVCAPGNWSDPEEAPYLTKGARLWVRAVRRGTPEGKAALRKAWDEPSLSPFRTALDTLGNTAFKIDTKILDAVTWAHANGFDIGGVPRSSPIELEMPSEEILESLSREKQGLLWDKFWETKDLNLSNKVQSASLHSDLSNLRLIEAYPRIYQPHYSDFRGRLYPASAISHHREDAIRSCFRFADELPLGDCGEQWIIRHCANSGSGDAYGKLDKLSWSDRENWVLDNRDLIREVATNWREKPELWTRTDHPFAFLQSCLELSSLGSLEPGSSSGLIIGLDGTCSGLQHYAAAMRSSEEGALVNLTPGEKPSDVYAAVAASVSRLLHALSTDASSSGRDQAVARLLLNHGVTRSTVKRQTMTFAYSSEVFGFRQQLYADLIYPLHRKVLSGELPYNPLEYEGDRGWYASLLMAKCIWKALQGVVHGAADGMQWIKTLAATLATHGQPMRWVTPSGFPVVHAYRESKSRQLRSFLGRKIVWLRLNEPTNRLLVHKQRSASAPNVIHSLDAAHLHLTVAAMERRGLPQLAMIHDSFGAPPGHVETLAQVLREEFVNMYENYDIFAELLANARGVLPESALDELPEITVKGDLAISSVLSSPYFFC